MSLELARSKLSLAEVEERRAKAEVKAETEAFIEATRIYKQKKNQLDIMRQEMKDIEN